MKLPKPRERKSFSRARRRTEMSSSKATRSVLRLRRLMSGSRGGGGGAGSAEDMDATGRGMLNEEPVMHRLRWWRAWHLDSARRVKRTVDASSWKDVTTPSKRTTVSLDIGRTGGVSSTSGCLI